MTPASVVNYMCFGTSERRAPIGEGYLVEPKPRLNDDEFDAGFSRGVIESVGADPG